MTTAEQEYRLDSIRLVFIPIQAAFFLIGLFFFAAAMRKPGLFSVETWGGFAHQFEARSWALYGMLAATITQRGLVMPMRYRWIIVGAAMHCLQFVALFYSAAVTGGDPAIAMYSLIMFLPLHAWLIVEAVRYGRKR